MELFFDVLTARLGLLRGCLVGWLRFVEACSFFFGCFVQRFMQAPCVWWIEDEGEGVIGSNTNVPRVEAQTAKAKKLN